MCKLSCNTFMPSTSCDNILALYFINYESYSCIHVSYVQNPREVKMDDIYIYNMSPRTSEGKKTYLEDDFEVSNIELVSATI